MVSDPPASVDDLRVPWTSFVACQPDARDPQSRIFLNSRYQAHVRVYPHPGDAAALVHISFRRRDRGIAIPPEDKRRLCDELVGPRFETIELYPAREREVDLSNHFHHWCLASEDFRWPMGEYMPALPQTPCCPADVASNVLGLPWTPCVSIEAQTANGEGCTEMALGAGNDDRGGWYQNSRYVVFVRSPVETHVLPGAIALVCWRRDGGWFVPYRDRMRLKDELLGPNHEGFELFPARGPSWFGHQPPCVLWIFEDDGFRLPLGFARRCVSDVSLDGAVQTPWPPDERPDDCLSESELRVLLQRSRGGMSDISLNA